MIDKWILNIMAFVFITISCVVVFLSHREDAGVVFAILNGFGWVCFGFSVLLGKLDEIKEALQ